MQFNNKLFVVGSTSRSIGLNPEMKKVNLGSREAGAEPESGEGVKARSGSPNPEKKRKNQKSLAN